jgi:hypothetical protein
LGHEVLEVSEGLEPVEDYLVIDPDVVMDEDVPEADGLADGASQAWSADAVLAGQSDGVAVVRRRSPPFHCANVLGDVHAALDRGDERVLDAPEPHGILPPDAAGCRLSLQHGDVVADAAEQAQDAVFVDHGLTCAWP